MVESERRYRPPAAGRLRRAWRAYRSAEFGWYAYAPTAAEASDAYDLRFPEGSENEGCNEAFCSDERPSPFGLSLVGSVDLANRVVRERYPDVRAAWLGGSVVRGDATAGSDLDVSVILDGAPAPLRESMVVDGIPIELFVNTLESHARFRAADQERRQPTSARLIAEAVLLFGDEVAQRLRADCAAEIAAGPQPLTDAERDRLRYVITDLRSDWRDSQDPAAHRLLVAMLVTEAATLLLAGEGRWLGTGKGLVRALRARDQDWLESHGETGDQWGERLTDVLVNEEYQPEQFEAAISAILDLHGGPLFDGYLVKG